MIHQKKCCRKFEISIRNYKEKKKSLLNYEEEVNHRYIGLLLVTNSTKVADSDETLHQITNEIYYNAELGNEECNNGILIIYVKDKMQVTQLLLQGHFKCM